MRKQRVMGRKKCFTNWYIFSFGFGVIFFYFHSSGIYEHNTFHFGVLFFFFFLLLNLFSFRQKLTMYSNPNEVKHFFVFQVKYEFITQQKNEDEKKKNISNSNNSKQFHLFKRNAK